ncbi:MAG TPA: hypothetical protein VME19_03120 [Streptosporangiaceae bacterium]|nr:hypothetical protein [Streptosporangiaceae bacterium]
MDGIRRRPAPSKRAANGRRPAGQLPNGHAAGLTGALRAGESPDREATRYLSAATQIDIKYAENVVDRVVNERLRALAPTFGVDVPVVAKWAIKAVRTRAVRDNLLTAILMLQLLLTVIVILWWDWAWTFIALLLIAAWLAVSWDYRERMHQIVRGKMLRDRFDPAEAPSPYRQPDVERLHEIAKRRDGNLAVFSGHSAFIGSGAPVYGQRLLLDIMGGKEPDTGTARKPDPFTSYDLHLAIIDAFGRERGLAKSLDNVRVYERLFVNGLHVQNNEQLLPNRLQAPPTSVDNRLLQAAAVRPSPEARTYVCVEMPGWQGQLVVTLFIRAVYAGDSLYVEYVFRALRPIRREFLLIDSLYDYSRFGQLKDSLRHGLWELIPALLASPGQVLGSRRRRGKTRREQSWSIHAIERGYVFDYGASRSIREYASGGQRQHYFLARDETMYLLLAQQTLIQAVRKFLSDHGIDLSQFDAQVKIIFDKSIHIGDIKDSTGVAVGDSASATVGGSPKGAE